MANIVEFIYKLTDRVSKPLEVIAKNTAGMQMQAEKAQSSIGRLGSAAVKFGAAFLGVQQIIKQGKAFVGLGVDMEQTRAKFEVLTGSLERGNGLIEQLTALSQTPLFGKQAMMGNAETLLAFGIEAEKVSGTLQMLGDIAMGDKNKLSGLTLAFAQMSSTGKLTGQDLLQMINQGFNPLVEISNKTGKSIAVLKDEMSKGAISSKMVEDAFRSATAEGGQFYGMSEKIAETVGGKFNSAIATLQEKLITMSERLKPLLSTVVDYFMAFADNFERFASIIWAALVPVRALANGISFLTNFFSRNRTVLIGLIAMYAIFRASLWAVTIQMKGWTVASMLQFHWLVLVEKAQKLLNATMLKNPFAAVAIALTLVIGAVVMLRKRTRETVDVLGEAEKAAKGFYAQERTQLDEIYNKLRKTNPASQERKRLVKELAEAYPELNKQQLADIANAKDLTKSYQELIAVISQRARVQAYNQMLQSEYEQIAEVDMALSGHLSPGASDAEKATHAKQLIEWSKGDKKQYGWIKDLGLTNDKLEDYVSSLEKAQKLQQAIGGMDLSTTGRGLTTTGGGSSASDISSLTGSGAKATNVNITFRNLIEFLNMYPSTLKEGVDEASDQLIEGLLRVVNSANRIAEN